VAYPATVRAIEGELGRLAAEHPTLCTRTALPNRTHEGRSVTYVTVGGADGGRPVLLTGGAHAREWAPPDALLSLLDGLLRAHAAGTAFAVAAFTDARGGGRPVEYPATTIGAADVRRIVERLELHVLALVNPDGRAFTQSSSANAMWRKNRRPPPPGSSCFGVDPNRNHDLAWDFDRYYDDAGDAAVSASKDPCDFQVYIGPSPASEPEVRNVASVLRERRIEFYVDVHSFSRKILFPWGTDDNQTREPSQTYRNPAWDGRRDGAPGGPYGEYIPAALRDEHVRIGTAMRDAILDAAGSDPRARARSQYDVEPSLALYPATGTASDYACSLQFEPDPPAPRVISYTLECGSDADGEGGFQPVPAIYPKVEREVHLSLIAFLLAATQ
jgi:murein tripeptide amidase MpaA